MNTSNHPEREYSSSATTFRQILRIFDKNHALSDGYPAIPIADERWSVYRKDNENEQTHPFILKTPRSAALKRLPASLPSWQTTVFGRLYLRQSIPLVIEQKQFLLYYLATAAVMGDREFTVVAVNQLFHERFDLISAQNEYFEWEVRELLEPQTGKTIASRAITRSTAETRPLGIKGFHGESAIEMQENEAERIIFMGTMIPTPLVNSEANVLRLDQLESVSTPAILLPPIFD